MKGFHLACWNFWPAETVHMIFERTGLLTNHKISSSCYITYFLNWDQLAMALWSRDYWHSPELALQTISCHSQAHVLMLPQRTDLLGKLRKRRPHANTRASKHRCHLPAMLGRPSGALPVRVVFTLQRPGLLLWHFWHLLPNLFTELNNKVIGEAVFATFSLHEMVLNLSFVIFSFHKEKVRWGSKGFHLPATPFGQYPKG